MRTVLMVLLTALAAAASACSDGDDPPGVTPSASARSTAAPPTRTPVPATNTPPPPTPLPTSTPRATPIAAPATLDGCPVDDASLCQFALDAQVALNAEDVGFFLSRLAPVTLPCDEVSPQIIPGCEDGTGPTGDPVVAFFSSNSGCCYIPVPDFANALPQWLAEQQLSDSWRIYALKVNAPFWDGSTSVVLLKGSSADAPLLEIGVANVDELGIAGVIKGALSLLYVAPESELSYWR